MLPDWFPQLSCADGGLVLKGIGRALVPEVIVDHQAESSAGQERAFTPDPPLDPNIQAESTSLWEE